MEITEVRIKLMEDSEDRLRAFCSITFDQCFVVRDLKIIEGTSGPFVAMPSRKLTGRCSRCGYKNHLRSNFCNQCGTKLRGAQELKDQESGNNRLYADIAHPINQRCRDLIQQEVVREYLMELERAKLPGYKSRYDDDYVETTQNEAEVEVASVVPAPHFGRDTKSESAMALGESSNSHDSSGKDAIQDSKTDDDGFGKGIL
jgi:stage V sporulation protein G